MKSILTVAALLLGTCAAGAQTWQCTNNGAVCQPGSANCVCAEILAAPVVAPPVVVQPPPACPFGTYWNGGVCMAVPQAPVYMPPPVYYPPSYWGGGLHPGVGVGPGGHVFVR